MEPTSIKVCLQCANSVLDDIIVKPNDIEQFLFDLNQVRLGQPGVTACFHQMYVLIYTLTYTPGLIQ